MASRTYRKQYRYVVTVYTFGPSKRCEVFHAGKVGVVEFDLLPTSTQIRAIFGVQDRQIEVGQSKEKGTILVCRKDGYPVGELRRIRPLRLSTPEPRRPHSCTLHAPTDERRKVKRATTASRKYRFLATLYSFGAERAFDVFHAGKVGIFAFDKYIPTKEQLKAAFGIDRSVPIEVAHDRTKGTIILCRRRDGYAVGELKRIRPLRIFKPRWEHRPGVSAHHGLQTNLSSASSSGGFPPVFGGQ